MVFTYLGKGGLAREREREKQGHESWRVLVVLMLLCSVVRCCVELCCVCYAVLYMICR